MLEILKILIIDDHQLIRDGIKTMLSSQDHKYVFHILEAECCEEGIMKVIAEDFDIVLIDYQMPDGVGSDALAKILSIKPKTKFLALSSYDEYACVLKMIEAGASGYILKNISPSELLLAIETVLAGKKYYAKEINEKIKTLKRKKITGKTHKDKFGISNRQIQILKLISNGMTNEEIARKLKLAKRTIDTHRQNLLTKLGVHNTAALIKKAIELSIL